MICPALNDRAWLRLTLAFSDKDVFPKFFVFSLLGRILLALVLYMLGWHWLSYWVTFIVGWHCKLALTNLLAVQSTFMFCIRLERKHSLT